MRIYADSLKPNIPYKTILLSTTDMADFAVVEALEKYGLEKENPREYCLARVTKHKTQHSNITLLSPPTCKHNPTLKHHATITTNMQTQHNIPTSRYYHHQHASTTLQHHATITTNMPTQHNTTSSIRLIILKHP